MAETGGPCIATEEFITYGHSTLGGGSQLLWLSRLHRTSHAKRRSRRNNTAKFSLTNSASSPPEFCADRTKGRHTISNFSLTTPSNLISWCDQMLAVASDLVHGRARQPGAPRSYRVGKNLRTARRSVPTIGNDAKRRDLAFYWRRSFATFSMRERGGTKRIASLQLQARLEFELRSALCSIKFR